MYVSQHNIHAFFMNKFRNKTIVEKLCHFQEIVLSISAFIAILFYVIYCLFSFLCITLFGMYRTRAQPHFIAACLNYMPTEFTKV